MTMKRLLVIPMFSVVIVGCADRPDSPGAEDQVKLSTPETVVSVAPLSGLKQAGLRPVGKSDVHWAVVQAEMTRITSTDPASPVGNRLETVGRMEGKASRTLFPGWRFYAFIYSNYKKPGFDSRPVSLAAGLGHTLAVSSDSTENVRLLHYGNYETYGDFLIRNKVLVRNSGEAKLVWHAFCEIHRKSWQNYGIERVSDHVWKLGIYSYDQTVADAGDGKAIVRRTHFMRVTTDPATNQVIAWKAVVETSDEKSSKTGAGHGSIRRDCEERYPREEATAGGNPCGDSIGLGTRHLAGHLD